MLKLSLRAQSLKPSPTLALAAKAKELTSQGKDVISLTVGEPDWDTFTEIKEAAISAIQSGQTKYAPANGIPELRQIIAEKTSQQLGVPYKAQDVTVSAGGKMVLFAALQVLCDPNDEVLIPAPFWVSYPTMVELAGATPKIVLCEKEQSFKITASQLRDSLNKKTKVFILNSPSNPTGEMYTAQELSALAEVLREFPEVTILSDDIYHRLIVSHKLGEEAPHLLQVAPDLKDRVLIVNGASKTYSMTGWRLGWALGPQVLISAITNYFSQSVSCASPFTQLAALAALKQSDAAVVKSVQKLSERGFKAFELLSSIPGIEVDLPKGAFYLWPSMKSFIGKKISGRMINGSRDFAELLLEEKMVAVVPGVEFGMEGYMRLSFVIQENRFAEAMTRMKELLNSK
ncbi:MAG: pyridoxal phosphate-dependent aminotransferase [Bdellovibrionales bacterium]|nr:pyridoxal phosphate-dependent aminotransferase [Bdellovibrionales bacterium]